MPENAFDLQSRKMSLNYAKLSYEIGNRTKAYLRFCWLFTKYPNNASRSVVEKLLIDSYISSKNYKEALILLEKIEALKINWRIKSYFYRGLELYADRDYAEAMFKKSIDGQIEAAITARATFWKAETEYVLDDYRNALLSFKQFSGLSRASSAPE
jgi:tetratricopeptide (TPR) repeat protein